MWLARARGTVITGSSTCHRASRLCRKRVTRRSDDGATGIVGADAAHEAHEPAIDVGILGLFRLRVLPQENRVVVEGVNIVKKHRKARSAEEQSGIIEMPAPIHHSKAMLIDPKTNEPTRVRRRKDADGTMERISVKSGESMPRSR